MNQRNISFIKYLIKISGIFFFLAGTFLTLCMIFLRWWPNFLFPLMALTGILILYFYKDARDDLYFHFLKSIKNLYGNTEVIISKLRVLIKIILITFIIIFSLIALIVIFGQDLLKQRNTKSECKEIANELNSYYGKYQQFPANLNVMISSKPLRQTWKTDAWGTPYNYQLLNNGKNFTLTSSGKDQTLNTEDDILFKQ